MALSWAAAAACLGLLSHEALAAAGWRAAGAPARVAVLAPEQGGPASIVAQRALDHLAAQTELVGERG